MQSSGIYVEILLQVPLEEVWRFTQVPALHQRWDLRFTEIDYLPRPNPAEPQRFRYATRIGFGLSICGTGESLAERAKGDGDTTSSLRFVSDDPKSLIRTGSGYWRYVEDPTGVHFFTWYDYEVRFGILGRLTDKIFRPLMGWATAWSFDRLRLWLEEGQTPEVSLRLSVIHACARFTIAAVWFWHGLVPKLLYANFDERIMLAQAGLPVSVLPFVGIAEIGIAALLLFTWRRRSILLANAAVMVVATLVVGLKSPAYLVAAFNPITLNLGVVALSLCGWVAGQNLPSARHCWRKPVNRSVREAA